MVQDADHAIMTLGKLSQEKAKVRDQIEASLETSGLVPQPAGVKPGVPKKEEETKEENNYVLPLAVGGLAVLLFIWR